MYYIKIVLSNDERSLIVAESFLLAKIKEITPTTIKVYFSFFETKVDSNMIAILLRIRLAIIGSGGDMYLLKNIVSELCTFSPWVNDSLAEEMLNETLYI